MNIKRAGKKLNTSSGFTLAEALVAILILLMVSSVVATGIPAARNAYEKVVLASNAEVLLSTTVSMLRNELGTASNVQIAEDGVTINYFNPSINSMSMISRNNAKAGKYIEKDVDDVIVYQRYAGATIGEAGKTNAVTRMIPAQTSTEGMYVTYTSVEQANGIITFRGLSVNQAKKTGDGDLRTGIAGRDEMSIRIISY